jgi:hypothetical protein
MGASEEGELKRRGPAVLFVLLLSLFAAAPSWAGPSANANRVVIDAEAKCVSGVNEASKRAKPAHAPGLLGTNPVVVTRLLFFRPASHGGPNRVELRTASRVSFYDARAPPAL